MCKTLAEGGQRCASHTREKLQKKAAAVEAAASSGDRTRLLAARAEWEEAAAEYASTNEGHTHLSAQAAAAEQTGDLNTASLLNTVVRRGEALRAANQETASLLAAVRLAQTPADNLPALAQTPGALSPLGEQAGPVVPDLSPKQRAEWASMVEQFEALAPEIQSCSTFSGVTYPSDILKGIPQIDAIIGDSDSNDEELAKAVRLAGHYEGMKHYLPQWKSKDSDSDTTRAEEMAKYEDRRNKWANFCPVLVSSLEAQTDRALGHPNVGEKTFEMAETKGLAHRKDLTERDNVPTGYLKSAIRKEKSNPDSMVHPKGWEKARVLSFNDPGMAMLVAAYDPDSFERNEAVNRVVMSSWDDMSEKERNWLASHLDEMPGSGENQKTLAYSLKTWATGYADKAERMSLGAILLTSNNGEVSQIGRSLLQADAPKEPEKKRWFRS